KLLNKSGGNCLILVMKKILLIVFLFLTAASQAQDTLFRIISVKGLVTLDGRIVTCGQRVTTANVALQISGKADYATILSEKGFAFLLSQGKYSATEISKAEYSTVHQRGAVNRDMPKSIVIAGMYDGISPLFGDSLTVIARSCTKQVKEYVLVIVDLMSKTLDESASAGHVKTVNVSDLFTEYDGIVFHIESDVRNITSREYGIKKIKPEDRIEIAYNFDCIQESNFISQEMSILALCEIHGLYYDQIHHLYKL
ncbi:unnamed protein product, partial [Phaeothamnion confervicola]